MVNEWLTADWYRHSAEPAAAIAAGQLSLAAGWSRAARGAIGSWSESRRLVAWAASNGLLGETCAAPARRRFLA